MSGPEWVRDAVFYQIFPDRFYNGDKKNDPEDTVNWADEPTTTNFFGGDLSGIVKKISYLEDLGVNALYLNPVFKSPSNHGYDTEDYYAIEPRLGTTETLKKLVGELHKRGIKLILDGVFNHCGLGFFAFQDLIKNGACSEYRDWFFVNFPVRQDPTPNYRCWRGVPSMPEFNTDNPETRNYLLRVVKYWIEHADIDGWRLDCVEYMDPQFVKEITETARRAKPTAYVVGEVMGIGTPWLKGKCLDAVMNYQLRDLLLDFVGGVDAQKFEQRLYALEMTCPPHAKDVMFNLIGSHDKPRFLTFSDLKKMKLAVVFQMTYPGAPVVYYGDEIGMEGGEDPECRRTFCWDKKTQNRDLRTFYRELIRLRRENESLRRGDFKVVHTDNAFCFIRELRKEAIMVLLNNSADDKRVKIPMENAWELKTISGEKPVLHEGHISVEVPAWGFGVYGVKYPPIN